jgi:hypothetical protein
MRLPAQDTSANVVIVAVVVLLFASGLAASAQASIDCSQFPIQDVQVNAPPADALNFLILGDGFQADELHTYRRAACLLVDGILSEQPFANFACRLNFYRIDSVSSYDDIPTNCAIHSPRTWTPVDAPACVSNDGGPPAASVATLDFNTEICPPSKPVKKLVWPDPAKVPTALTLAEVCPPFTVHAILLLSDTETPAAAAQAGGATPKLTVTTLAAIDKDASRHYRIAHELGHTLLLLDEYKDKDWESDSYLCGRNVWSPCDDCNGDGVPDTPFQASWHEHCEPWQPLSNAQEVAGCNGALQVSPCQLGLCATVGACPIPCGVRALELPAVGLYEGGFYEECGYYRSQRFCRMEDNIKFPFCKACLCSAKQFLEDDMGLAECGSPTICEPVRPEIFMRDCHADGGASPSGCPQAGLSPDLLFQVKTKSFAGDVIEHTLDVTACATNGWKTLTAGQLFADFSVTYSGPGLGFSSTLARSIDTLVPPPGETIPTPLAWVPGEHRCLTAQAVFMVPDPVGTLTFDARVTVRMPGDPPQSAGGMLDDDNKASGSVQVHHPIPGPNGNLFVNLTDGDGTPILGVTITLSGALWTRTVETDAQGEGRFLRVPPGSYVLQVSLGGFATAIRNVVIESAANLTVPIMLEASP